MWVYFNEGAKNVETSDTRREERGEKVVAATVSTSSIEVIQIWNVRKIIKYDNYSKVGKKEIMKINWNKQNWMKRTI